MKCAEEPLVIGDERSFVDVKKHAKVVRPSRKFADFSPNVCSGGGVPNLCLRLRFIGGY